MPTKEYWKAKRRPIIKEDVVLIPLTKGQVATVDREDYDRIPELDLLWIAAWNAETASFYAYRKDKNEVNISLQRLVMGAKPGDVVDFINHDTLDCRKVNLRFATASQDSMNQKIQKGRKFKGVTFSGIKWHAQLKKNKVHVFLGAYDTAEQAALAYDKMAKELFGEFCYLNFPDKDTTDFKIKKRIRTSEFRGVSFHKLTGRWKAKIRPHPGFSGYIGLFDTEEEAARAYDRKARELYGTEARANFP